MANFALPNLGEDIDEADVLKVLVNEGDVITIDQPVIEIETEKATLEVPSEVAGRVTKIHIASGDTVKPGQLLIEVEADGGGASAAPAPAQTAAQPAAPATPTAGASLATPAVPAVPATPPPPVDPMSIAPAGAAPRPPTVPPSPRASTAPAPPRPPAPGAATTHPPADQPVFAPPSVRQFAREIGIDLATVTGSGPGGRISEDDVKRAARERAAQRPTAPAAAAPAAEHRALPDFTQWGPVSREPLSRLRRTLARNMAQSWTDIPHAHLFHHADVTAMEAMRQQYRERARAAGGNLTISVMMLKVVAAALRAHPRINATLDLESGDMITKDYVHLGVAVDTDRGLVVPKIENVDEKNIIELSIELNDIAKRARENTLQLEEMRGSTFTVTNLGSLGTGYFAPIINWPEIAILGLGRAEQVPVLDGERWVPELRMPLSFGMDHRAIDGADGARFMSWIVEAIKNPLIMALEG